jgi:hypothetical protein
MIDRISFSVGAEWTPDEFHLRLEQRFRGQSVLELAVRFGASSVEKDSLFDDLWM